MITAELRPWGPADAEALLAAKSTSPDLATQLPDTGLDSIAQAAAYIRDHLGSGPRHANWAISVDGRALGNVGMSAVERRHDTAWVYYWLGVDGRGQGLARRALASVSAFAFQQGLFRLELGHRVNNPASCAVARGAGFAAEGLERAKLRYGSERYDVETHARLATDPAPRLELLPLATAQVCLAE